MDAKSILVWKQNRIYADGKRLNCLAEYTIHRVVKQDRCEYLWKFVKDRSDIFFSGSNTNKAHKQAQAAANKDGYLFILDSITAKTAVSIGDKRDSYFTLLRLRSGHSAVTEFILGHFTEEDRRNYLTKRLGL